MSTRSVERSEDLRQIEHLAPIGFAFLLPYLEYRQIVLLACLAVAYALVSPRLLPLTARADERARGLSRGKLFYALSVLGLVVVFAESLHVAAGAWAILAFGDSLSNLAGRRFGRHPLPYNRAKSWEGFGIFVLAGGAAGWALLLWTWPAGREAPLELLGAAFSAALLAGLGESLPTIIDDNLVVAWIAGLWLGILFSLNEQSGPVAQGEILVAVGVNAALVLLSVGLRWLSVGATAAAFALGTLIFVAGGVPAYLSIVLFLALGSITTRLGLAHKISLRIAEAQGGRRGLRNVLSKGLVPCLAAVLMLWESDPVLRVGYVAALATSAFDTVSTEIGQWLGGRPILLWRLQRVSQGTPGAVSLTGTAAGLGAAVCITLPALLLGWLPGAALAPVLAAATAANFSESLIGSLAERRHPYADDALNLLSSLFGATLGALLWRSFAGWGS